jgi:hypothetical protein
MRRRSRSWAIYRAAVSRDNRRHFLSLMRKEREASCLLNLIGPMCNKIEDSQPGIYLILRPTNR